MNIAHIESSYSWGGQELRTIEQCEWLLKNSYHTWIIAREGSEIIKEAKKRNIPFYILDLRGSINPNTILKLINFIKKNHIDILDSHSNRDASYSMFVRLFTVAKVIRSRHVTNRIKNDFFRRFVWKRGNDQIVTTAHKIKDDIIKLKLAEEEKINVALAGVDEQRFDYQLNRDDLKKKLNIPDNHIVISNIGMIRKDKGQLHYVRACKQIAKLIDNVTFLQIGEATSGTKKYKEQVLKESESLIQNGHLKFLGYKSDIENYIDITDIVIIASVKTEAQTRLVSQAFLMKKNVIATKVGGLPEMIQDTVTGTLCLPASPNDITQAAITLIKDPHKQKEINENAYHYALKTMTFDQMMKHMIDIYTKTLTL